MKVVLAVLTLALLAACTAHGYMVRAGTAETDGALNGTDPITVTPSVLHLGNGITYVANVKTRFGPVSFTIKPRPWAPCAHVRADGRSKGAYRFEISQEWDGRCYIRFTDAHGDAAVLKALNHA